MGTGHVMYTHDSTNGSLLSWCRPFPDNEAYCYAVIAIRVTTSVITLILVCLVIFIIWLYKMHKILPPRMVVNLCIACILESFINFLPYFHDDNLCIFKGFMSNVISWTKLMWVLCITLNMYLVGIRDKNTDPYEWRYYFVCWTVPFGISVLPLIYNKYGPAGAWCWIKNDFSWRLAVWYVPMNIGIAILFASYIYIVIKVYKESQRYEGHFDPHTLQKKTRMKEHVKSMVGYPFVFLVAAVFPLIHRIYNGVTGEDSFPLMLLHTISSPLQGSLYAVVFVLHGSVRDQIKPMNIKNQMRLRVQRQRSETVISEYPTTVTTPPPESGVVNPAFFDELESAPGPTMDTSV